MHDAGTMLAKIQDYHFPRAGFFDKDLSIGHATSQDVCIEFARQCLKNPMVLKCLPEKTIVKIGLNFEKYKTLLPDGNETHLVHADYDPANILVNIASGSCKITGMHAITTRYCMVLKKSQCKFCDYWRNQNRTAP